MQEKINTTETDHQGLSVQGTVVWIGILLFFVKIAAWYLTGSVSVLSDALESLVNIFAGFIGLYSLKLAATPRDANHPYGHGKAEFVSSALEGVLVGLAGLGILYEAVLHLIHPDDLQSLNTGMFLIAMSAGTNGVMGLWSIKRGKQLKSPVLLAGGKHLLTDTWSTLAILAGLFLIQVTGLRWIDGLVAAMMSVIILWQAYSILRSSVSGMMDEADEELIEELLTVIHPHRKPTWIDLHNLRIIRYGSTLHIDCHLTVPWYYTVQEAHQELDDFERLIKEKFQTNTELFVHADPCMPYSCGICSVKECKERTARFNQILEWTADRVRTNQKHSVSSPGQTN